MSQRLRILQKPHWTSLLDRPGIEDLPLSVLKAADSFLEYRSRAALADPLVEDFSSWAGQGEDRTSALTSLSSAMKVIAPELLPRIEAAGREHVATALPPPASAASGRKGRSSRARREAGPWDPIAPPSRRPPVKRHVSIDPRDLPAEWQGALRRMARGFPQNGVEAPAREIIKRMRDKLCQLAWSAQQAGLPVELSPATMARFESDVRKRSEARKHGIRWATVRASMEEVYRFARYSGAAEEVVTFAAARLWRLSRFENGQRALKFYELARTGHTTLSILDLADELLTKSGTDACPKARHRRRQHAAILGIFAVAPLRNASAELVLGETLFWEGAEWVIDMPIQKTEGRNPEQFVYPLAAQHGAFIDAVILGDYASEHLPALRGTAIATRRPLFVHFDGSPTGRTFIPRSFKEITDNSFTTLRTMLHTDLGIALGPAGTEMAMVAEHQVGATTAKKYQAEIVARVSAQRAQERTRRRRAQAFDPPP
jgi:hypothetical protein